MIFIVEYELGTLRKTPIKNGYRPDWVSTSKPEYNCGTLSLDGDREFVQVGEKNVQALLIPLRPELWLTVKKGEVLESREGAATSGVAVVRGVFKSLSLLLPEKMTRHGRCSACPRIFHSRWVPGVLSTAQEAPADLDYHMPCPKCGGKIDVVR
jgi:hypothetical protein